MKAKEKQLLEYLQRYCPGRENAISGKQLKKRFRIHEAELRKLVHNLRVDGAPICIHSFPTRRSSDRKSVV